MAVDRRSTVHEAGPTKIKKQPFALILILGKIVYNANVV